LKIVLLITLLTAACAYQPTVYYVNEPLTEQCRWEYKVTEADFGGRWSICEELNRYCYCVEELPTDEEFLARKEIEGWIRDDEAYHKYDY
jgi:hypothetical protein